MSFHTKGRAHAKTLESFLSSTTSITVPLGLLHVFSYDAAFTRAAWDARRGRRAWRRRLDAEASVGADGTRTARAIGVSPS
mmetsp:Transcript_5867/g.26395  ORF Transcript_5867/g.26395 Transcript_5867/m.26395 type:complete len:81 (+) Transcript_5867:591-833(+)